MRKAILGALFIVLAGLAAFAQANGKLQLHFMDVDQADSALIISPQGETVLVDLGVKGQCDKPLSYLQQLGIDKIDYVVVSHYDKDHIGCATEILAAYPLQKDALDRGKKGKKTWFNPYVKAVGTHRKTVTQGMKVKLDGSSSTPVVLDFVALNGNGVQGAKNENDMSIAMVLRFANFDAVFAGDMAGKKTSSYRDIESSVAPLVKEVEVYKVNHHCSASSTEVTWLNTTKPEIGIISVGDGNPHHHPTGDCLDRLHQAAVKTYWTERGTGARPVPGKDVIGGNIIVQVDPADPDSFTVRYGGNFVDEYAVKGAAPIPPKSTLPKYAWSTKSKYYHAASCRYVDNIDPQNLQRGDEAPAAKAPHDDCLKQD